MLTKEYVIKLYHKVITRQISIEDFTNLIIQKLDYTIVDIDYSPTLPPLPPKKPSFIEKVKGLFK